MIDVDRRSVLEQLDAAAADDDELLASLAFLAAQAVSLDPDELHAARRRALLLLASGGDPRRELEAGGRAVRALADDLDEPELRAQVLRSLAALREQAQGLGRVAAAIDALGADPNAAWRWVACALLAEELAGEA